MLAWLRLACQRALVCYVTVTLVEGRRTAVESKSNRILRYRKMNFSITLGLRML